MEDWYGVNKFNVQKFVRDSIKDVGFRIINQNYSLTSHTEHAQA